MMTSWEERQRQVLLEGHAALERTSDSIRRSEQVALETEAIGTTVVADLDRQRETLLRAGRRLDDIDHGLSRTQSILNGMTRHVLTNKLLLILIIICECGILSSLVYLKYLRK
ncbi:vesicle transport through interaction with t-SNAREs 1b [Lycorma delicatula]|uniref:vesicle transport through interaction with t-SNAREs 1b n=1 Tax=Lycorma delicatula TaxID=130591 RepID=UPI003F5109D4